MIMECRYCDDQAKFNVWAPGNEAHACRKHLPRTVEHVVGLIGGSVKVTRLGLAEADETIGRTEVPAMSCGCRHRLSCPDRP